jgi:hypothetical protein
MFGGFIKSRLAALLFLGPLLVACGGTTTLVSTPSPSPPSAEAEEILGQTERESADSDEGSSPPASTVAELGSRDDPAPVGSTALISDASGQPIWEVTLLETELNVNEVVAKENQFNDPPPADFQYAAAEFSVTYLGSEKGFPSMDLSVAFVTADGTTHKPSDVSVVGPKELSNANELYQGGTAVGSAYIAIPTAGASTGTWRISQFLNDSEFFFAAQ